MFTYEFPYITLLLNGNSQTTLVDIAITIKLIPEIDFVTKVEVVFLFTIVSTDLNKKDSNLFFQSFFVELRF